MIIEVHFIREEGDVPEGGVPLSGKVIRIEGVDITEDKAFYVSTSNFVENFPDGKKELTGKGSIEIRAKGKIPVWKENGNA